MISISMSGERTIRRNLRKLERDLLYAVEREVDRALLPAGLRRWIPKDTGRLRGSLRVTKRTMINGKRWTVELGGWRAPYVFFVDSNGQRFAPKFVNRVHSRLRRGLRRVRL